MCKRANELAVKAGEPADIAAAIEADCTARLGEAQGSYAKALECMQGAEDLRQLKACELPLTGYKSMFAALAPSPEKLCDHVVTLMVAELGEQVPQDQIPMIREKCVADASKNAEMQGEAFAEQARCILSKSSITELRDCEGPGGGSGPPPRPSGPPPGAMGPGGAPPGAMAPGGAPPGAVAPGGAPPGATPPAAPPAGETQPVQPPPAAPTPG